MNFRGSCGLAVAAIFVIAAMAGCSDDPSPSARLRVEPRAATVRAFIGGNQRFTAVLGPLPDPIDNPVWHRDRLRERLDPNGKSEYLSLRVFRIDDGASSPSFSNLRLELEDGERVVVAREIAVPAPQEGEDPELRVLRARTSAAFRDAVIPSNAGFELWWMIDAPSSPAGFSSATLELDGERIELTANTVEAEQIATLIERPTRDNLRAIGKRAGLPAILDPAR